MPGEGLQVGGLTPITTIDYPDNLSAVIFCQGCPMRCHYCHNRQLQPRLTDNPMSWKDIIDFLTTRIGLLDAVVFSGGEPTLQRSIGKAIEEIKRLGYRVGLHTAGIYPQRFEQLLSMIDWVGLDIKALAADYPSLTGITNSGESAWHSARLLVASGVAYEIRTTLYPGIDNPEYKHRLQGELMRLGEINHRWQPYRQLPGNDPTQRLG
ncbi:anaerobic ribonucleoside-triphosphate reductase activating protein [Candidatus Thiodiazotropha sp. CDECU1]|uniref:anaerobic ribonucleoside-triphosphate reductase activating protein n=1 Tax=Candidatus Thiodiazotropha sp. CDECU1 TaxID=3065865 RepID=UPI002930AB2E|nr:anaerobic ribonucleoside-triphosphate reductase activating protein [Candidatus Thiodiazotropha sp. CDECU1]